jgi:type I restriction enzyme R subunit
MSAQLREIIELRKTKAIEYEEYLRRIAELARRVEAGQAEDTPAQLNTPGRRALYSNLKKRAPSGAGMHAAAPSASATVDVVDLAIRIDSIVKHVRPDSWRGVQAREQVIKSALYGVLQDMAEVERIFLIVKAQSEY